MLKNTLSGFCYEIVVFSLSLLCKIEQYVLNFYIVLDREQLI